MPPTQNVTSPSTMSMVEIVIFALASTLKKGTPSNDKKSRVDSEIKAIPVMNFQFLCIMKDLLLKQQKAIKFDINFHFPLFKIGLPPFW
jgi:hypothetical protein